MSFNRLKIDQLHALADEFGVEVDPDANKPVIIAALAENGVTWDMAKKADKEVAAVDVEVEEEKKVEKEAGPKALLKMTRKNPLFEVLGYRFTKAHPFAIVAEEDAEHIVENIEGFSYATPKEAERFYS